MQMKAQENKQFFMMLGLIMATGLSAMHCGGSDDPECTPQCSQKTCGESDGCEGRCTGCPAGETCNQTTWVCEPTGCTPDCTGKTCGDSDGCEGKCTGCPAGEVCNQTTWVCEQGSTDQSCSSDDHCPMERCIDNLDFGYCGGECYRDNDCVQGMHCFDKSDNFILPGTCVARCQQPEECLDLMDCFDGDGDGKIECLPIELDIGQACFTDSDCQGTHCSNGTSVEPIFPGGYCLASCVSESICPRGSHCVELAVYNTRICAKTCTNSTPCVRNGYECRDQDSDGQDECVYAGPIGDLETGEACGYHQECQGGVCLTTNNFPGGYCSQLCENTACVPGSICYSNTTTPVCLKTCDSAWDCRTPEYDCRDAGLSQNVCFKSL